MISTIRPLATLSIAPSDKPLPHSSPLFGALQLQGSRAQVFEALSRLEQPFKLLELGERPNPLVNPGDQVALVHFDLNRTQRAAHDGLQASIDGSATARHHYPGLDMVFVHGNQRPVGNTVFPSPNNPVPALSLISHDESGIKGLWKTLLAVLQAPDSKPLTDQLNTIHTKPLEVAGEHRTVLSFKPDTPQAVVGQLPAFKQALTVAHDYPVIVSEYRRAK